MHHSLVGTRGHETMPKPFRTWQFVQGGEALAAVFDATAAPAGIALRLATAMAAELRKIDVTIEDADMRARVAMAAAVTALVLPECRLVADDAIARWVGPGVGHPRRMRDPKAIFARALLALVRNDGDDAVRCLDSLTERFPTYANIGALHDLVVARVQWHGHTRESACLANLLFVCRDEPSLRAIGELCRATPTPVSRRRTPRTAWPQARQWPM
jgi:hypothetical protein